MTAQMTGNLPVIAVTGYNRLPARRELIATQLTGDQNSFFCEKCQAYFDKYETDFDCVSTA
jgi:hypothetical protein